jgi:hypothetical protein
MDRIPSSFVVLMQLSFAALAHLLAGMINKTN